MNLYVPLGSAPDIGRKRLLCMGASADVETAQSMYPYITPHDAKTEGGDHGPRLPSRPRVTPQHHVGVLAGFLPPMRKCCGVVQRQPGWPTP
jgi:hypothetical protein